MKETENERLVSEDINDTIVDEPLESTSPKEAKTPEVQVEVKSAEELDEELDEEYDDYDDEVAVARNPIESRGPKVEDTAWWLLWGIVLVVAAVGAVVLFFIFRDPEDPSAGRVAIRKKVPRNISHMSDVDIKWSPDEETDEADAKKAKEPRKPSPPPRTVERRRRRPRPTRRYSRPRRQPRPEPTRRPVEVKQPEPPPPPPPPKPTPVPEAPKPEPPPPPPPPKPKPVKPPPGFFKIVTGVPITIIVDGWKTKSRGGATNIKLAPGPHQVTIIFDKTGKKLARRILIKSGKTVALRLVRNK